MNAGAWIMEGSGVRSAEGDSECKPSYYRYRQSCSYLACWFVLIRLARRRRNACFSRTQIFAKNVTCGPTDSLFLREIVIFSTANHYIIERKQAREAFLSSRMAADCGIVVAKYCLKLFNFLFFIAGAILLSVGFWLAIDKNSFVRLLTKISQDTTLHQFSQPTVIEQASWILIAAGGFVFVLSCLGYCGAYQESPFMLGTYSILVVAILALEITAAGLAINYKTEADTNTREFLKSTISKYYATADKADAVTLMWNYLMAQVTPPFSPPSLAFPC
ncbi:Hypothetical predicted protein [Cloeon dipterum]|uniref:Tetraspanin n=1 Tax=Cloeon dipterum TaxID=197152 RepID=A0A8S1D5C8_9INSE|nr:Hypothetical predicted protein [Cloeon dipterum]